MKRYLQIGNILAYVFTLVMNGLATTGALGGLSIKTVSDKYETFLTPATYAFGIWGLIYLLLLVFVVFQARDLMRPNASNELPTKMAGWFMLSSVANGLWTLLFVRQAVLASLITIAVLAASLYMIIYKLNIAREDNQAKRILCIWWPILIYTGWVTVALVVNAASYVRYAGGHVNTLAALLVLAILTLGLLALLVTRHVRELLLASAWGIAAVGVARLHTGLPNTTVAVGAFVTAGILVAACALHAYYMRPAKSR